MFLSDQGTRCGSTYTNINLFYAISAFFVPYMDL